MANRKTQSKAAKPPSLPPIKTDVNAERFDNLSLKLNTIKGFADMLFMASCYPEVTESLDDETMPAVLSELLGHVRDAQKLTSELNGALRPIPQ